jgi:hypothetical protein
MTERLDPAATIIDMCGGYEKTAAILGLHRTTVYRWTQPVLPRPGRSGTGGLVPIRYALQLIFAQPALTAEHFLRNMGKPHNEG